MFSVMKKYMMAALLLMGATATRAQAPAEKCGARGARMIQMMEDSIGINAEQKVKLQAIHAETCTKMQAARQAAGEDKEQAKNAMKAIRKESVEKIKAVLTPEQQQKLAAIKKQQHGKPGHHRMHGRDSMREGMARNMTERMKTELSLTEAQVPQVEALNQTLENRMKALREKKGQGAGEEELKALRKSIMREYREGLAKILTPEQREILKKKRETHKPGNHRERKPAHGGMYTPGR
jgi:Spy/CpxP family protein refolding chaperone